ncbi:MAG: hypothetical protein AAF850_04930 [Pseudomonadota bacterium]
MKLKCGAHGLQDETFVCVHITEALATGVASGFYWNSNGGVFEALCEACNALSADEFERNADTIVRSLCFGCFKDAAALNGIDIS